MKTLSRLITFSFFLVLAFACPVAAAEQTGALFGGYWAGFAEHWEGVFQRQNGIAMAIVGLGIVALFIITRGKWQK